MKGRLTLMGIYASDCLKYSDYVYREAPKRELYYSRGGFYVLYIITPLI